MARKPQLWNKRLSNNVRDGLDDILALCLWAGEAWRQAQARAEGEMDAVMLARLGTLRDYLARIERKARAAREGRYE